MNIRWIVDIVCKSLPNQTSCIFLGKISVEIVLDKRGRVGLDTFTNLHNVGKWGYTASGLTNYTFLPPNCEFLIKGNWGIRFSWNKLSTDLILGRLQSFSFWKIMFDICSQWCRGLVLYVNTSVRYISGEFLSSASVSISSIIYITVNILFSFISSQMKFLSLFSISLWNICICIRKRYIRKLGLPCSLNCTYSWTRMRPSPLERKKRNFLNLPQTDKE